MATATYLQTGLTIADPYGSLVVELEREKVSEVAYSELNVAHKAVFDADKHGTNQPAPRGLRVKVDGKTVFDDIPTEEEVRRERGKRLLGRAATELGIEIDPDLTEKVKELGAEPERTVTVELTEKEARYLLNHGGGTSGATKLRQALEDST